MEGVFVIIIFGMGHGEKKFRLVMNRYTQVVGQHFQRLQLDLRYPSMSNLTIIFKFHDIYVYNGNQVSQ